jgi:hypothetical protein
MKARRPVLWLLAGAAALVPVVLVCWISSRDGGDGHEVARGDYRVSPPQDPDGPDGDAQVPEYTGAGTAGSPIVIDCSPGVPAGAVSVRLKDMDHKEVTRVHWVLVNNGAEPVTFRRLDSDCTCVDVHPRAGVVAPGGRLEGHLDYTQGTLGYTRRVVIFDTGTPRRVELTSLKRRDQYVEPTEIKTVDGDFTVTWRGLRRRDAAVPSYRLTARVQTDE